MRHIDTIQLKPTKIKIHDLENIDKGLKLMNDIGCTVYMLYGNHDYEPLITGSNILVLDYINYSCEKNKYDKIRLPEMDYITLDEEFEDKYMHIITEIKSLISRDKKIWSEPEYLATEYTVITECADVWKTISDRIKKILTIKSTFGDRNKKCVIKSVMIDGNKHTFISSDEYEEENMDPAVLANEIMKYEMGEYVYSHYPLMGLKKKKISQFRRNILEALILKKCK